MTPTRVLDHINKTAAEHETTSARILSGDMSHETVEARHAAIKELAQLPKPTGRKPSIREVARWFRVNPSTVSRICGEQTEREREAV